MGELLHTKTQAVLSHYLTQESLVVAFQDCHVVFAVVLSPPPWRACASRVARRSSNSARRG